MRTTVQLPSGFHRKILAQEAPGGMPTALSLVIPTVTRPGRPFVLKVAILDRDGYPSLACGGRLRVERPSGGEARVRFRAGEPAVAALAGLVCETIGLFRLHARYEGLEADSNPSLCTAEEVPGIYWGDPHVHTVLSNCHPTRCRSLNFCYTAARYLSGLDWVSAADHVSNGRCEFARWKEQRTVANLFDDPPAFATLPAYEASLKGGCGGDNNVYMTRFPDLFVDDYENGTVRTLCDKLGEIMGPGEFFVVPHHTTRTGKHGEIPDAIHPGPERMPVLEIHSKWGTSEYRGNPNPLQTVHPGPSYAQDFLARGLRFGFVAGTDSHATMASGGGVEPGHIDRFPGLTAVFARDLSRQAVFEAMRSRHCYAASLERILLHGTVAGCRFGEASTLDRLPERPRIEMDVAARSDLRRIDVVRNGETIHSEAPDGWRTRLVFEDGDPAGAVATAASGRRWVYYYVRVTCSSGAQAWTSPVWFEA